MFERGSDICHETVRYWWNRFRPMFAADIRRQRVNRMRGFQHWRWHLDEMYVKLNGEMVYLWRAVDQEGEILENYITKTRDKAAALTFMKKALKRHGSPEAITTDGLHSYRAAMTALGNADKQEIGRWANNRVENSHLSFRRRERTMLRFRRMKSLQKFASVHTNVHNHFNHDRHLVDRETYKAKGEPVPEANESLLRHQRLREVPYTEVPELLKFIEGSTPFATQHSVKGAEFDNVLVVLGGGWNHYNWPRFLELFETKALDNKNTKGFLRTRNLFYVAVSRPRKNLTVLATQTFSAAALKTVVRLFGANGVEQLPLEQLGS
ncbi:MAG: IS6 family transposase [Novosphingobium sp.]